MLFTKKNALNSPINLSRSPDFTVGNPPFFRQEKLRLLASSTGALFLSSMGTAERVDVFVISVGKIGKLVGSEIQKADIE